jgi:transposase
LTCTATELLLSAKTTIFPFHTLTENLRELAAWLQAQGVTDVAMESTGVYCPHGFPWEKPVYNLLDGRFEILGVNAEHVKALKGSKTDVQDAEWLADLFRHGLLNGSFIPSAHLPELRDLTRYRTKLGDDRKSEINRLHKVLEDANLKLSRVATDLMGVSAQAIVAELVKGNTDAALLAELAKGRLREKQEQLQEALVGNLQAHHRFMLAQLLSHIEFLDDAIAKLDDQIA